MAWETRKGCKGRYYTRTKKLNGRVIRQYIGIGPAAELAAEADAMSQAKRRELRQSIRDEQDRLAAAVEPLAHLVKATDLLLHAALALEGYHWVDRHWRRLRND